MEEEDENTVYLTFNQASSTKKNMKSMRMSGREVKKEKEILVNLDSQGEEKRSSSQ